MKDWFKYEFGYVNIDKENIYFTNSGNWSETKELKEKGIQKSNFSRKSSLQLFIIACLLLCAYLLFKGFEKNKLILTLPIGLYFMYNYLKPEIGSKYKLPISKIKNIDIDNTTVTIHFIDALTTEKSETLTKVEIKGIQILEKLK
jgi:hypothetical protein